jgi:hypothetical protein
LGSNVWGLGPAAVLVKLAGPIVAGVLVNNVFSLGGTSGPGGTRYSLMTVNPFFNYNFGEGWYVGTSSIITANWQTSGNNAWTLPVGADMGRVIKIGGKLPVNLQIGAYYKLSDFSGAYGAARAGAVAGDAELKGGLWMENPAGVQIHMVPRRSGLAGVSSGYAEASPGQAPRRGFPSTRRACVFSGCG